MVKTGICGQVNDYYEILENVLDIPELSLVGFYNPNLLNTNDFNKIDNKIKSYKHVDTLLDDVDAVIALSPLSDSKSLETLVKSSKHVFFEPNSRFYSGDFNKLTNIIDEANVKVQAGFHHRFNNSFLSAKPFIKKPKFIQSQNFKQYRHEFDTNTLLLDLLIKDIDIVLSVVPYNIKNIKANSNSPNIANLDIINVRIEFMNGSVADLTVGKIATEDYSEINFYSDKDLVQINFNKNTAKHIKKNDNIHINSLFQTNIGDLIIDDIPIKPNNFYFDEISSFAKSIIYNKEPEVDINEVLKTYEIMACIKEKLKLNDF